jgi:hypothetical protein
MKSSHEIAMERLNKTSPTTETTTKQKKELAELDSLYAAKIAERELALSQEMAAVRDPEKEEVVRNQLGQERKKLQAELEEKKERCEVGRAERKMAGVGVSTTDRLQTPNFCLLPSTALTLTPVILRSS